MEISTNGDWIDTSNWPTMRQVVDTRAELEATNLEVRRALYDGTIRRRPESLEEYTPNVGTTIDRVRLDNFHYVRDIDHVYDSNHRSDSITTTGNDSRITAASAFGSMHNGASLSFDRTHIDSDLHSILTGSLEKELSVTNPDVEELKQEIARLRGIILDMSRSSNESNV